MFFHILYFCILCLPIMVSPYGFQEKDKYMRIDLVRQKSPRNQIAQHHERLLNYGFDINKELAPGPKIGGGPRTNDSINLFRYLDNEFYGQIVIGHPGQTMNVAFDTAWTLTWVLSKKCQVYETKGCSGHKLYDHDRSSYYKKNGTQYIGEEGAYNFTGFYSYENISIAHSNVTGYSFVEMVEVPDILALTKADGILGLGLQDSDYEPFLYTLHRQKKIANLMFSIYLNRDRQSNRGGNIMLGFYDKKHVHRTQLKNKTIVYDTITYLKVDSDQYWQFTVDRIDLVINPKNITTFCANKCQAISDTTSNQIVGPKADVDKIHDMINAQQYQNRYTVDCDKISKLPKIDVVLGNKPFRLTGKQYIIQEKVDPDHPFTICYSSFTPNDGDMWILGGAFMSQYYSIYNINEKTIGFVRAA